LWLATCFAWDRVTGPPTLEMMTASR